MHDAQAGTAYGAGEAARLRALASYEVLDTPPDEHFDALARWAARLCHCPIARVTLVDERRQWIKAQTGSGDPESPRTNTFCDHAIQGDGLFEVPDACQDPRFADNPLVTGDPHVRFYACVPLVVEGGHTLGTLAVLDHEPRRLTAQERADLHALAGQVVLALEERRLRLRAERASAEARRQSDSLLAIAGRVARLGAWELDVGAGKVTWSDVVADIHGMPPGFSPAVADALAFYVEPGRSTLSAAVDHCLRTGTPFDFELVLQPASGGPVRWVRSIGEAVRNAEGRITHLRGACQDITDRKSQQMELQRLTDRLVATLESVPDPFLAVGRDGTIEHANAAVERLARRPRGELVGRTLSSVIPEGALTTSLPERCQQALASRRPVEFDTVDARSQRHFEVRIFPIDDGLTIHARDITGKKAAESHRQALEQRLLQAQKMESIGTLAGGIAHDFNNILGAILGNVALARGALAPDAPGQAALATIAGSAQRARSLVQQILAFASCQATHRVRVPLGPLVDETVQLLRSTLSANVTLRPLLPASEVYAEVDRNQLQQVLINLCTNAWDALPPGGGLIELGLEAEAAGATGAAHAGPVAHLWVQDNGCGIDAKAQARIFEPFFSTKEVGKGTGLGLSASHGIVLAHGGTISVDSQPGAGSVFHIRLPACPPPGPASAATGPDERTVALHGVRVLCVDDDGVMLMTMQALLEREGCAVTACLEPEQALDLIQRSPDSADLLVTDFNMPGMDGLALVQAIRQLRPDLPVVLASGFMSDSLAERARAIGVGTLTQKERAVEDLVGAVRQALAQGAGVV